MAVNRNSNKTNNSTIISFEEFEYAVMQKILEEDTSVNRLLREQYKNAQVVSRDFTGVGFFTKLKVSEHAARITEPVEYGYGSVTCDLNGILCGFVLFINDGVMICLEGYTFCDPWPSRIVTYRLYNGGKYS